MYIFRHIMYYVLYTFTFPSPPFYMICNVIICIWLIMKLFIVPMHYVELITCPNCIRVNFLTFYLHAELRWSCLSSVMEIRKIASLLITAGVVLCVVWVNTEVNVVNQNTCGIFVVRSGYFWFCSRWNVLNL